MKKTLIFAMNYIYRGETKLRLSRAFFFVLLIILSGFTPPCGGLMAPLPLWCSSTGKVEPLFYSTKNKSIEKVMNKPQNNCKVSTIRRPESTIDARNALQLSFQSHYPLIKFNFIDTGNLFLAKASFGSERIKIKASALAMLSLKLNNKLIEVFPDQRNVLVSHAWMVSQIHELSKVLNAMSFTLQS